MTVSEYILGTIAIAVVLIVLIGVFILTLYSAGWWYTLGKLDAINSFFKSKSPKENYIFTSSHTAEYLNQLSRMRAYDDYYKTKNEKENE